MDDEKLINLIHSYDCLYNLSSHNYSDRALKANAWKVISKKMEKPISDCQKQWKLLRDNFRKALFARLNKSEDAKGKRRHIKFEKQLEFLKPYLQQRYRKSNLDTYSEDTHDLQNYTRSDISRPLRNESPRSLSEISTESQPKASEILERYLTAKEAEHTVDNFFLTMASTVKKLPERVQAEIKRKIFLIVSDAEITNYNESTGTCRFSGENNLDDEETEEYIVPMIVDTCYAGHSASMGTYTSTSDTESYKITTKKNIPTTTTYTPTIQGSFTADTTSTPDSKDAVDLNL